MLALYGARDQLKTNCKSGKHATNGSTYSELHQDRSEDRHSEQQPGYMSQAWLTLPAIFRKVSLEEQQQQKKSPKQPSSPRFKFLLILNLFCVIYQNSQSSINQVRLSGSLCPFLSGDAYGGCLTHVEVLRIILLLKYRDCCVPHYLHTEQNVASGSPGPNLHAPVIRHSQTKPAKQYTTAAEVTTRKASTIPVTSRNLIL